MASNKKSAKTKQSNEEEDVVYLQFSGLMDAQQFKDGCPPVKLLGINEEEPILQIGTNSFFKGKYDNLIGTAVFFEEKKPTNKSKSESDFSSETSEVKRLSYLTKTNKTLNFKRIFLEAKEKSSEKQ